MLLIGHLSFYLSLASKFSSILILLRGRRACKLRMVCQQVGMVADAFIASTNQLGRHGFSVSELFTLRLGRL